MGSDRRHERGRARAAALPGARAGWRLPGLSLEAPRAWLWARLVEEADAGRPALWAPVAFSVGVVVYFAAGREPELWAAVLLAAMGAAAVLAARRRFLALGLALAFAFGAFGFLAAKLAAERAAAPRLERAQRAEVVGRVLKVEPRDRGHRRVTLAVESFGALEAGARPRRVRATLGPEPRMTAGDRLSLSAFWRPPQQPLRPGGYDFALMAYFDGIGATGAQARDVRLRDRPPEEGMERVSAALERLRERLTERIAATVGGPEGAVAAALVTGVRGPIPQAVEDDLRAAGLSHILSISGLHMALVAGTLFWLVRALFAASERAALRLPVKALAAAVALAGATFYLALSGAEVATQRSYLMAGIVFAAILIGRPAVTPRNLALAALLVLALAPQALLGPSFQMSFAAVAALIATFEVWSARRREAEPGGRFERLLAAASRIALAAVVTTLVAGLATAPFAAYHFHRVTPYALAGNALATPLISLIVMPSVVGGLLFAPLGLDGPWWRLMGFGLEGVLAIARMVASWPGAERMSGAFSATALVLFALGLAWLCLWRTALRGAAVVPLGVALALSVWPHRPDVVIHPEGRAMAARGPDGELRLLGVGPGGFAGKVWLAADGVDPEARAKAAKEARAERNVSAAQTRRKGRENAHQGAPPSPFKPRCDRYGCIAPLDGGGEAALIWDPRAFDEDCRRAALVVTRLDAPAACGDHAAVIDRRVLAATGALELTRQGDRFHAVAGRAPASDRPWSRAAESAPPDALRLSFAPRRNSPALASPAADGLSPVDPTDPDDDADLNPDDDQ
ncbi:competence protein ComEC [Methylopila jiangsuensis]|nr:ComEC/Rec2 family competence protein [Methylopila jiangsuensis]MDR6285836.1 competence protein ComEC [Methylopila jiangsuensis]